MLLLGHSNVLSNGSIAYFREDHFSGGRPGAEAETSRFRDAINFAKDVTKGFVSDLRSGLEQGKGFWRSFADAALNALDKVIDKLLNDLIDALFRVNKTASGMGGGGGLLGFLGGLFGLGDGGLGANYFPPAPIGGGGFHTLGAGMPAVSPGLGLSGAFDTLSDRVLRMQMPANNNPVPRPYAVPSARHSLSQATTPAAGSNARPIYQDNRTFKIDARGAQAGVGDEIKRALQEYDREVLPARVNQIANDPYARG